MRVEQRIGRIDRYGQRSEKVRIISFFLADTIEERILQRLYERIGVFEESIGTLEPILGDIVRELSYDVIRRDLTPEEETRKAEEFLRTLAHRKLQMEEFEQHRYELMVPDTAFIKQVEDNIANGRFVSAKEIRALVFSYISKMCRMSYLEEIDSAEDVWRLMPDEALIDNLRTFLSSKASRAGREDWSFFSRLQTCMGGGRRLWRTSKPGLPLTFNSRVAMERPLLEFVNVWHPLVRLAFSTLNQAVHPDPEARIVQFKVKANLGAPSGIYYFFLFYLSCKAIVESQEITSVVIDVNGNINRKLSDSFLKVLLDNLSEGSEAPETAFDLGLCRSLKEKALEFMAVVRRDRELSARQQNDSLIALRRDALEKTFAVKRRRAQVRLENATDSRIIRMHQGELRNLKNKLDAAIMELETKREVTVVYEPIACGLMELCRDG
jgi:hypothetical protein